MWRLSQRRHFKRNPSFFIESLEGRTLLSAPVVQSETFNRDGTQSIAVQFSTNVSASVNNTTLVLYNLTNRTTMLSNAIGFAYNTATNTATFSINYVPPGSSVTTHDLPDDGNYQAILYADRVTDSAGTPMAADSVYNFTFYKGDANGDKTVNALDFNALATSYGKSGRVFSQGDFDLNGTVNSADFDVLAGRFGKTLAAPTPAPRQMDVATYNATSDGSASHYNDATFAAQNTPQVGGYMMFMGNDNERAALQALGNSLGIYFNNFTVNIQTGDPAAMIATVQQWCTQYFTNTGVQPTYIVLNELSKSLWPTADYRSWLSTIIHSLHEVYGHEVILYSPYSAPTTNPADWAALSKDCYIAAEKYISGATMKAENFSVSWAEKQYQNTLLDYNAMGVPTSRLIEGEEYAMTVAGNAVGRSGVSYADWDSTIISRAEAIHEVGYYGAIGYAWSKNAMLDTEADQIHFEQTYRAQVLP